MVCCGTNADGPIATLPWERSKWRVRQYRVREQHPAYVRKARIERQRIAPKKTGKNCTKGQGPRSDPSDQRRRYRDTCADRGEERHEAGSIVKAEDVGKRTREWAHARLRQRATAQKWWSRFAVMGPCEKFSERHCVDSRIA